MKMQRAKLYFSGMNIGQIIIKKNEINCLHYYESVIE